MKSSNQSYSKIFLENGSSGDFTKKQTLFIRDKDVKNVKITEVYSDYFTTITMCKIPYNAECYLIKFYEDIEKQKLSVSIIKEGKITEIFHTYGRWAEFAYPNWIEKVTKQNYKRKE